MASPSCSICGGYQNSLLVDLGTTPIAGDFSPIPHERTHYPLSLRICSSCSHAEIVDKLSPQLLYDNTFSYISSSSPGLIEYFKQILDIILSSNSPNNSTPLWLDIGSNDGTLLDLVSLAGFSTYGIEPAKYQASYSRHTGLHKIYEGYCSTEAFEYLEISKYDVISILNTLSNCISPMDILSIAAEKLSDSGVIIISTGDLESVCLGNLDYIYHEHNHYFSKESLYRAAEFLNLRIIRIDKSLQKGGSLLVLLAKNRSSILMSTLSPKPFDYLSMISASMTRLSAKQESVHEQVNRLFDCDTPLLAFGASQSTTTLVSLLKLHSKISLYIDDNPHKQLTHSPFGNRPVVSTKVLNQLLESNKKVAIFPAAWRFIDNWLFRHDLHREKLLTIIQFSLR